MKSETLKISAIFTLLAAILLMTACGGSDKSDSDNPIPHGDDDDTTVIPGELTRGAAEDVMRGVVTQLQTQQNIEQFTNLGSFIPQGVPQGKIGAIGDEIKVPGEVPCQELDMAMGNEMIEITIRYEGLCELSDGSTQSGTISMKIEGNETKGSIRIEFDGYIKDGVESDGAVSVQFDKSGQDETMTISFDHFVGDGGVMNGSLTAKVALDGSSGEFFFDDFSANGERLDGYFEMTTDNATTVRIKMDLDADTDEGKVSGQYEYSLTDHQDGTATFVGNGTFYDESLAQTVSVDYDFTIDPAQCGDIPREGHMTVSDGEQTITGTFNCDDFLIQ